MSFRAVTLCARYFVQALKGKLAYRGDFLALVGGSLLVSVIGLLFIVILIDGQIVQDLRGWNREEILFIYGLSTCATALFGVLSPNIWGFGSRYVVDGEFDRVLLRPLPTLPQILFESFSLESAGSFLLGIAIMYYSVTELGIEVSVVDKLWLTMSMVSGAVILLAVFVSLASMSFHYEDRLGLGAPVYNMILFSRYPLPIFNSIIQFLLSWILPFAFVSFYPATHVLGRSDFQTLCYFTPVMAMIAFCVMLGLWTLGVRNYGSTGN